jgi:uncharacterized protein (DUF111 family)
MGSNVMKQEQMCEISASLDGMSGEDIRFLLESVLEQGALDAWAAPVVTRGRSPAYRLSVQCDKEDATRMCGLVLKNSAVTSLTLEVKSRIMMAEEILYIETSMGMVRLSVAGGKQSIVHEDVAKVARKHNMSIAEAREKLLEEMEQ